MRTKHHALLLLLVGIVFNGLITSSAFAGSTRIIGSNNATSNNLHPTISADGRYVAFYSNSDQLVTGDTNNSYDVFLHDKDTDLIERISVASDGTEGNGNSVYPSISQDGRYVVFYSTATNLVTADNNASSDVFLHDRQMNTTVLISRSAGTQTDSASYSPSISADGRFVTYFSSATNIVGNDSNGVDDIFIYDRQLTITERVSVATDGSEANALSRFPVISSDGRYVSFYSDASNLVANDSNLKGDVFIHDRNTGTTERVSVATGGLEANNHSLLPSLSADGRYIVFESSADNLIAADTNNTKDIFIHDRTSQTTQIVSVNDDGIQGDSISQHASISANGRFITFMSAATNFSAADNNGVDDVFIRDQVTGTNKIVSIASSGEIGTGRSLTGYKISSSENGRYIAFYSLASNLVVNDNNPSYDIFVHDLEISSQLPPIANAGADQQLECIATLSDVTLDGSASTHPNNEPLSFSWSGIFGTAIGEIVTVSLPTGAHTITLDVQDAQSTASDSLLVTVLDSIAPILDPLANVVLEATSAQGASYNLSPSATDVCSDVSITLTPDLSIYPLGSTTVNIEAVDQSGNTASTSVIVTVEDRTNPVLTVPGDITAASTGPLTPVDLGIATATDIFAVTIDNDAPAAGFPSGTSDVTWTATDANGNSVSQVQRITITGDTEKPLVQAALIRLRGSDDDSGRFRVEYSCTDTGSGIKNLNADLNGVAVDTGEVVLLILDDDVRKPRYNTKQYLRMIASRFDLNVSCEDAAGNIATTTVRAPLYDD